jgi:threonine synthase
LAGLRRAKEQKMIESDEYPILDATAHSLKFLKFQEMYFDGNFPPEYEISPKKEYSNTPVSLLSEQQKDSSSYEKFIAQAAQKVVSLLDLKTKDREPGA